MTEHASRLLKVLAKLHGTAGSLESFSAAGLSED